MDIETIKMKKKEVMERCGPWTAHNIQLAEDVYTIDKRVVGSPRLGRVVQMIVDVANKPLEKLRILDLGCLEGLYSVELALQGAEIVGIEGREASVEKSRFVKEVLSLENLEFYLDDVRNLSKKKYGSFDIVLCLGILYHLDAPDVVQFMESISDVCREAAIIDTHVSLYAKESFLFNRKKYWGKSYKEHDPRSTIEERKKSMWASLDNETSFWLTYPSLCNLLTDVGFTSAYECENPPEPKNPRDRVMLLAVKNKPRRLISTPLANGLINRWTEKDNSIMARVRGSLRLLFSK